MSEQRPAGLGSRLGERLRGEFQVGTETTTLQWE